MHVHSLRPARPALLACWTLLALATGAVGAAPDDGQSQADGTRSVPATFPAGPPRRPMLLEDVPAPLVPKQPRTEADRDRLEALALFAAGRIRQRRMDQAGALRLYQRAFRYDPQALTVGRAIVPLAFRLNRHDEAVRYALKVVELEDAGPLLLRSLAKHLVKAGDLERAVTLYERAVAARAGQTETAADVVMQLKMGQFHHLVGQPKKAADNFARVLYALEHPQQFQLDEKTSKLLLGEAAATYNLFGEAFLMADRFDEALAAFEKANELAPDAGLFGYNRARVNARTGRPAEALQTLAAYFDAHLATQGADPYQLLAEVLKALDKEGELIGRLEKLRGEDPGNVPLRYFLADKYREAGQFDKAEPVYLEVLKKTPTLAGYRSLVDIYHKTDQPERLLDVLAELAGKTASLEPLGAEGEALSGDKALVGRVIEAARRRLKQDPKTLSYEARLGTALLATECKQPETAAELFDLAIQAEPKHTAELLLLWGVGLLVENNYGEAARVFRRGIDQKLLPEENPAFHFYLAGALEMDGRTEEALTAARAASAVKSDQARFHGRPAWVLYHAERYPEAEKAYTELIRKFDSKHESPENRRVLRDARLALSNMCVLGNRMAEGEEWLNQVLDEFPDDVGALNDLGYLWANQGKHLQRALRMVQKAVEGDPDNVAYRDSLGWALFRLERYKEALMELQSAASGENPDAVILDHLGDTYHQLDQPQKARDAWQRAVKVLHKEGKDEKAAEVEKKITSSKQQK